MKCASGEIIIKRKDFLKSLEGGAEAIRNADVYILDYKFKKEEIAYKERKETMEKDDKPYDNTNSIYKKVYNSVTGKVEKNNKKLGDIKAIQDNEKMQEWSGWKKYKTLAEKQEELKGVLKNTKKEWERLMKIYEKCELKDLYLDKKILEFDFNRVNKVNDFADFSLKKYEEFGLKATEGKPSIFEDMKSNYDDLLVKLGSVTFKNYNEVDRNGVTRLTSAYNEYKEVLKKNKEKADEIDKCVIPVKAEFKKHEKSALGRSKTLEKNQNQLAEMNRTRNNGQEFKNLRNSAEGKYKEHCWTSWALKKTGEKGKSFGRKIKDLAYRPLSKLRSR